MPDQIKIVTRDEFVEASKAGDADGMAIRKAFAAELKAIDGKARTIDFVISTAAVDRMNDTIAVDGWTFENYLKSPVVLWAHDSSMPPVGRALSVSRDKAALRSKAEFMDRDLSPFADSIFRMYQQGFLSAVSVGFVPIKFAFSSEKGREFGLDFQTQDLLEYSCCPVPANPEALMAARSAGIDTAPLAEWAEKILDGEGKILVPRPFLEEVFRAAKTPRAVQNKYLMSATQSDSSEWHACAAIDLPLSDGLDWDASGALARMFAAAGFDGDAPDAAALRRGFLVYDAANPTLKASYMLPFADIIGGELKAVPGGILACGPRLQRFNAPDTVLELARSALGGYEGRLKPVKSVARRDVARGLVKDLDNVSWLASIIQSLAMLEDWVEWETEVEGDGSDIADRLTAVLQSLAQVLMDMTAEEVAELLGEEADEAGDVAKMMVEKTPGQRAVIGLAQIMRAGRKISAANQALLTKAMDLHQQATDCVKSVMSSNNDEPLEGDGDPTAVHDPVQMSAGGQKAVESVVGLDAERDRRLRHAKALALAAANI